MLPSSRAQLIENKDIFISCVVPVFNEEANIIPFITQLNVCLSELTKTFEIIIIDDGSKDSTLEKAQHLAKINPAIKLISFSRNFGKESALTAGLEHSSGDVTIILDADFQHPLEVLPLFLQKWSTGYDMVYGIRENRDNESRAKRSFAKLFYWLMEKMTQIDIPSNAGDFRLLDRKIVTTLNRFKEHSRFMKGLYAWVGFKKIAISYSVQERAAGKSSWGFVKLTELAITGITSFSNVPLRIWGFIGFIISLLSLIYAVYIIAVTLIYGADLPGFPTLAAAIMFFGGIQLLSIGILGEYIARIFSEVKNRPNYIIDVKQGFDTKNEI
ncbi:MAG: glycosyltransferase family 2 protein [Gammaproteobacteria bacterium]|nr:glycosyltransferase family 2 protein [Gammaproteobacteria bacterium]